MSQSTETSPSSPVFETSAVETNGAAYIYKSPVITILVGPSALRLHAHEAALLHSPFLKAICISQLKEGHREQIILPEEDEEGFIAVLDYLYTFKVASWSEEARDHRYSFYLAHLYIVGDRYQLPRFQTLVLEELKALTFRNGHLTFLNSSRTIYENTMDSDPYFRPFFRAMMRASPFVGTFLDDTEKLILSGGPMAVDIYRALAKQNLKIQVGKEETAMLKAVYEGGKRFFDEASASALLKLAEYKAV